jgi:hypothetical protein
LKAEYKKVNADSQRAVWFTFCKFLAATLGEPNTPWKEDVVLLISGAKDYQEVLNG